MTNLYVFLKGWCMKLDFSAPIRIKEHLNQNLPAVDGLYGYSSHTYSPDEADYFEFLYRKHFRVSLLLIQS